MNNETVLMSSPFKVVLGLGQTGLSCVRYLIAKGSKLIVMDSRNQPPYLDILQRDYPQVPSILGRFDTKLLLQAEELIISPGIALTEPAIQAALQAQIPIAGDIELFCRAVTTPRVAITGSNAKSTVTSLVGAMALQANLNTQIAGNIGVPVLDLLSPTLQTAIDWYVLELSSFQLETTAALQASVATILNISPDHMDRYPSLIAYQAAKQRIYQQCKKIVVNREDKLTYPTMSSDAEIFSFGLDTPQQPNDFGLLEHRGQSCLAQYNRALLPVAELKIQGLHNYANALAALAVGTAMGLPEAAMLTAMKNFVGLPHRCQWIAQYQDVAWYNDSKGTNVGATLAAIQGIGQAIQGKIILIAGGEGKGADFAPLQASVKRYCRAAVLIGRDAEQLEKVLKTATQVVKADSMQAAVQQSAALAQPQDAVLLSPACASFDMFNNYQHRGEVFAAAVKQLNQFQQAVSL